MSGLVVCWDSNVDEPQRRVGVADSNDGDVYIGGLTDSLVVYPWVGDDDEAGLLERAGDVVCERTGSESSSNSLGTCVLSKLEDGTLAIGTSRDGDNVVGILDGGNHTGGKDDLFPDFSDVDDVDTYASVNTGSSNSFGRESVPSGRRL